MTNFQRDLIRYLETTDGEDHPSVAHEFFYGEVEYWGIQSWKREDTTPQHFKNMNVSFEEIDHYGGEDQGSDYWTVYKFTDNASGEEVFIKFEGWYQSYNGAEYTGLSVVQPKEKTVVVYE